uniref:EF-hand domain-containing protein n=1 Tax=Solanum tuberosum TaxID=4113 RepID=M1B695_SOLTU
MCDFDQNGTMSFEEFVELNKFLLKSFDRNKNGKFRLDDFISLCIFVQSARNLFDSFDTTKQGRVTLDINQFIYCSEYLEGILPFTIF